MSIGTRASALFAGVVFVVSTLQAAPPPHRLKLKAGTDHIAVEKATPGGTVLLAGFEQFARDYTAVHRRVDRKATVAGDGTARLDVSRPLKESSFWVVIDLTTGAYAAVTADGSKVPEAELPSSSLKKESNGKAKKVVTQLEYVQALLVRPAVGTWEMVTGDGGPGDTDGAVNGRIEIDASRLVRYEDTSVDAGEVQPGDLLFLFLPREMGYFVTEVAK